MKYENDMINVLDKGYVRYVDKLGSDLTIVNAARVSFDKESKELNDKDRNLIKHLADGGHTSPFRHGMLQFEVYAPLMVARQWWKYVVGSDHTMDAWNESSRRYVTEDSEFYIPAPDEWRSYPENVKQGSGEPLDMMQGSMLTQLLASHVRTGEELYEQAMLMGVAPELARTFLPANSLYVRFYWTASVQAVSHLINQRTAPDAQHEFREFALAVWAHAEEYFPESILNLCGGVEE